MTVSCDVDGAEPLDLTLGALCTAETVPAERARTALIRAQRPTEFTAQWVRFAGPPDANASVLARRALAVKDGVVLPVAARDDRFITFKRPGVSPITVHASALGADGGWTLPATGPGGELVARTPRAVVTAVKYHLIGRTHANASPVQNVVGFSAIGAGQYEIVPEYEGGLRGEHIPVPIQDGEVTFVALHEEDVGAVQLSVDAALCSTAANFTIAAIRSNTRAGATSVETLLTLPNRAACVQTIAGLRPGEYQVVVRGGTGPLGVQRFEVAAQAVTPLAVTNDSVLVSGRVSLNGEALPNVVIRFIPDGSAPRDVTTRTNQDGFYDLTMPSPGRFQVWFERDGFAMLGNEREVTLDPGANRSDFELDGATLKVTLRQWTRRAPVEISVRPIEMSRPGKVGDSRQLRPTEPLPIVFSGLSYGKYVIQARERPAQGQGGERIGGAMATLDDTRPETEVEVVLSDTPGVVRVIDQAGDPIAGAFVKAGEDRLLQTSPGVFSLANTAPATTVLASAPGFTPVLRLVSNESPFEIALTRGRQVRLQYAGGNPPIAKGSFVWAGTDARVPLHFFTVTRASDGTGDFVIHDFPTAPDVVFIAGPFDPPEQYQRVRPDANGVLRVR